MSDEQVAGVRRRSREEADQLAAEYEASGLSRRKFCQERGLALGTLDLYRKRRRQRRGAAKAEKRLVKVEVSRCESGEATGSRLLVVLGSGRRIEVGRGFDGQTLKQLMAVLEQG